MRLGTILRDTVAASAALAVLVLIVAIALGHLSIGLGLAAGLVIGAFNGHAVAGLLERKAPFVVGSILRMAAISAVAILVAVLIRSNAWAVLLGVGGAQAVMVAASIRQGLRAA